MNKHLLKMFLVLSLFLCLGFSKTDDDLDMNLTICETLKNLVVLQAVEITKRQKMEPFL